MKHKGIAKKAGTFLITAILAAAFAVQTAAAVPAESEKAALTIQASSDGTGIAGVEWSVYQVAEMPQDGVFILTGDFAASGLDIDGLNDSSQSAMQKNAVKSAAFVLSLIHISAVSPAVKVWGNILIPSGGEAVVIFEAAFKSKTEFSGNNINTTQTNSAGWYRSSDVQREKNLGRDDATVFVNLNTLQESDVTFRKTIVNAGTGGSQPAVGSDVTYNLMAGLTGGVHNSHWITVKDEWPGSCLLYTSRCV